VGQGLNFLPPCGLCGLVCDFLCRCTATPPSQISCWYVFISSSKKGGKGQRPERRRQCAITKALLLMEEWEGEGRGGEGGGGEGEGESKHAELPFHPP
jgi:hypothetical protein